MAESPLKNECCQDILERMQAEENNSDPAPMVVKNAAAAASLSVIPDINKMKKKKKRKPTVVISPVRALLLDTWNMRHVWKNADGTSSNERHIDPWLLRETHPDLVAVEKDARSDIAEIDVKKYLVPKDALLGDFIAYVRMWIFLKKRKPIFVFFKNTIPPKGATMGAIGEENTDEDGFLHMTYSGNDTFSYSGNDVTC
ncbi:autophagy-related protein 8c-like isoform X2 [Prunus dulcis]|uniref:autophagy-related protein 8c-like isoform X2 n=1 Tax=Prunus dulcis TaxID=3755 RepID=UPI00148326E3|nr:autophagy-related protein 8c-like isoform X2 [Prunus dulcis]